MIHGDVRTTQNKNSVHLSHSAETTKTSRTRSDTEIQSPTKAPS